MFGRAVQQKFDSIQDMDNDITKVIHQPLLSDTSDGGMIT